MQIPEQDQNFQLISQNPIKNSVMASNFASDIQPSWCLYLHFFICDDSDGDTTKPFVELN